MPGRRVGGLSASARTQSLEAVSLFDAGGQADGGSRGTRTHPVGRARWSGIQHQPAQSELRHRRRTPSAPVRRRSAFINVFPADQSATPGRQSGHRRRWFPIAPVVPICAKFCWSRAVRPIVCRLRPVSIEIMPIRKIANTSSVSDEWPRRCAFKKPVGSAMVGNRRLDDHRR
jgi:hypothetical protein